MGEVKFGGCGIDVLGQKQISRGGDGEKEVDLINIQSLVTDQK